MQLDNALYAGVQIPHNFGAAAAVALPLAALHFEVTGPTLRRIYWLALFAWLVQSASGVGFGIRAPTAAHGARLPPEDTFVAAAIWGSADRFDRSARDAG